MIAPLELVGLAPEVRVLGERWQRKSEIHLTAIAERAIALGPPGLSDAARRLAPGRSLGPVTLTPDVRRVSDPDRRELRTLIVIVRCPGLLALYAELSGLLRVRLEPPPAHVTLYSSDPDLGIGIIDRGELLERAPALSAEEADAVRSALRLVPG